MHNLNDLPQGVRNAIAALPLAVDELVRVIPNRRYVCSGVFNQQAVFTKIFIGKSAAAYAMRDKSGTGLLQLAQILTPQLLLTRQLDNGAYILIYEAVEKAQNAERALLQSSNVEQRLLLMRQLLQTVAKHHQAGLLQTDLHLKNFLVQHTSDALKIYTLDGDGIRKIGRFRAKTKRLSNLATLFSKFDVLEDVLISQFYRQYCATIGLNWHVSDERRVGKLVWRIRYQVTRTYADKKVFRSCTDVKVEKSFNCFRALAANFELPLRPAELDAYLADAAVNLKNGNTCTVGIGRLANQTVVIKRYNIKNFWHGLVRALRPSRAAVSWANAHRLLISNIATPKPLALVEERWGCLRRRAYFLSTYVEAPDVAQFFASNPDAKSAVADNLAALFLKLFALRYAHGDCKASNIKIVDSQPMLIDLDSLRSYGGSVASNCFFEHAHVRDLKRLMKNWQHDADTQDLLKQVFQKTYPDTAKAVLIRAGLV